jgi:hypothetical protein
VPVEGGEESSERILADCLLPKRWPAQKKISLLNPCKAAGQKGIARAPPWVRPSPIRTSLNTGEAVLSLGSTFTTRSGAGPVGPARIDLGCLEVILPE